MSDVKKERNEIKIVKSLIYYFKKSSSNTQYAVKEHYLFVTVYDQLVIVLL